MLNLSALTIQELCSNYISVVREDELETENKQIPLNSLINYIRINGVYDGERVVKHKIINRNILLEEDGKFLVKYCTYPNIQSLFDEIDFLNDFSPDVVVMGLCSYYAITKGMFKEFDVFHEKYLEKANTIKELKMFELPLRRWE